MDKPHKFRVGTGVEVIYHLRRHMRGRKGRVLAVFDNELRVWFHCLGEWETVPAKSVRHFSIVDRLADLLDE